MTDLFTPDQPSANPDANTRYQRNLHWRRMTRNFNHNPAYWASDANRIHFLLTGTHA